MEKIDQYQTWVREYLLDLADYHPDDQTGIPFTLIEDVLSRHLMLMEIGHGLQGWEYGIVMHFRIDDRLEQVILLCNNTDLDPFDSLTEKGIPYDDLVIGWVNNETWQAIQDPSA